MAKPLPPRAQSSDNIPSFYVTEVLPNYRGYRLTVFEPLDIDALSIVRRELQECIEHILLPANGPKRTIPSRRH
jgi:hypothetical protein